MASVRIVLTTHAATVAYVLSRLKNVLYFDEIPLSKLLSTFQQEYPTLQGLLYIAIWTYDEPGA